MSDVPKHGSVSHQLFPEDRLTADASASLDFTEAAANVNVEEIDTRTGETSVEEASAEDKGRARFEAIKAQCRYCGRALEPDCSL
ncbi:MAG: hypothetical protein AAGG57_12095 [Pseudomonadota bacterium]